MSVNMSVTDLSDPGLFESISEIVRHAGIDPMDLVLEITESVLLDDTARTMAFLGELKELGVGLALDDFGTAFSSLSYVRRFPFDRLKLDISFTSEIPDSTRSMLLVEEICHLSRSMMMTSIAEGIERHEQADALRAIGCDCGQGHLFSKALSASDCEDFLAARQGSLADQGGAEPTAPPGSEPCDSESAPEAGSRENTASSRHSLNLSVRPGLTDHVRRKAAEELPSRAAPRRRAAQQPGRRRRQRRGPPDCRS